MGICGPSDISEANQRAQTDFYKQLVTQQSQTFAQQQETLARIKAITDPIIAGGMNQYGFTTSEESLLESNIRDTGAKGTADAIAAQKLRDVQATGGAPVLPTGASAEESLIANELGEQQTATNLGNLKLKGFELGRENFITALNAQLGTAQLQNPTASATAATSGGAQATDATKLVDSERSNLLQTMLGGAIQGGLDIATGGVAQALKIKPYGA